jgi:hypothetical protein
MKAQKSTQTQELNTMHIPSAVGEKMFCQNSSAPKHEK